MPTPPPPTPLDAGLSLDDLEREVKAAPPGEEEETDRGTGGVGAGGEELGAPPVAAELDAPPLCPPPPASPAPPGLEAISAKSAPIPPEPVAERVTLLGWEPEQTPLVTSWLVSFAIHLILILLLATFVRWMSPPEGTTLTFYSPADGHVEQPIEIVDIKPSDLVVGETPDRPAAIEHDPADRQLLSELPNIPAPQSETPEPAPADVSDQSDLTLPPQLLRPLKPGGGGLEGRDAKTRARLVVSRGGSPGSEEAVARALKWLAAHQRPGGSWRFDLDGPCRGQCKNPGNHGSTTAATGLALLPFLGAGHTPDRGEYHEVVKDGIYYLTARMLDTPYGGDLQEGTMYSQGIATIALCEAYTMTQDPDLKRSCQKAINFICHAQHPAGGWRYFPGQPGDTTVFGWQLMALKSGQLGKLDVPSPVIEAARGYLDSVQSNGGAHYGYLKSGRDPTPTAVGLLSRMYLGWDQQDPRLGQGAAWLALNGPSKEDMYYNYYATQVLHHLDSSEWPKWNKKLRDYLVAQQVKTGHEAGSWYFADPHGQGGGRLYCTALATMILEVYYRHMPLYESRTVDEAF